jgi:hypothetical protein
LLTLEFAIINIVVSCYAVYSALDQFVPGSGTILLILCVVGVLLLVGAGPEPTLTKTLTLRNPVFDGKTIYAAGSYGFQYNVQNH